MSVRVMSLVWDYSEANAEQVPTLLALADRADDEGRCWPSIEDLARRTRRSESSVRRHIRALEELGELVVERVPGRSNLYRIAVAVLESRWKPSTTDPTLSEGCHGDTPSTVEGVSPCQGGVSPVTGGGVMGDTRTIKNHQEPSQVFDPSRIEASNTTADESDNDDVERSFAIWYARYPRKTARARALRAYRSALKHGAAPDELLDGLTRYRFDRRPEYVPHPATWLNDGRWSDESSPLGERVFDEQTQTWVTAATRSDDELVFDPATQTYRRGGQR